METRLGSGADSEQARNLTRELVGPIASDDETSDQLTTEMAQYPELGLAIAAEERAAGWWRRGKSDALVDFVLFNQQMRIPDDLDRNMKWLASFLLGVGYYVGNSGSTEAMTDFRGDVEAWGPRLQPPDERATDESVATTHLPVHEPSAIGWSRRSLSADEPPKQGRLTLTPRGIAFEGRLIPWPDIEGAYFPTEVDDAIFPFWLSPVLQARFKEGGPVQLQLSLVGDSGSLYWSLYGFGIMVQGLGNARHDWADYLKEHGVDVTIEDDSTFDE